MADSNAFDFVCGELEARTSLDRLEARGTVRLALKQAGFEARRVSPTQMSVVVDKVLPEELASRGVEGGAEVCTAIGQGLLALSDAAAAESPDAVFERLGGPA